MVCFADLHTHSTASDGQYEPAELVKMAKAMGLDALALTDHDTAYGIPEAQEAGKRLGVRIIPGIEMSAIEYPTFHILGYGFSTAGTPLADFCVDLATGRRERAERIIAYLKGKGFSVSMEDVQEKAQGAVIGRPHFAALMVERNFVDNRREAFDMYLDTEEFHRDVDFAKPSGRECVEMIKASGGLVSLAHPYQIGLDTAELEALIRRMKDWGLDAIECWHSGHSQEMSALYLSLARKYGLHVTGGSDFHGERVKPGIELLRLALDLSWLPSALK